MVREESEDEKKQRNKRETDVIGFVDMRNFDRTLFAGDKRYRKETNDN